MNSEFWGHTGAGEAVHRFCLRADGIEAHILTYGGIIAALRVPDRTGQIANIVLGLASLADYEARSPHFGALTGRYANRIAHGRFILDGTDYQLACNNGPNALHGGPTGFGKRIWTVAEAAPHRLVLARNSPDGEEGYPGALSVTVAYTAEPHALRIDYTATTDRPTVLNLTNHSYFNLAGEGEGDVLGHTLRLDADHYLPVDATLIPTGELRPVGGTSFDFRTPVPIGASIREGDEQLIHGQGYDHCWALRGGIVPQPRTAARVLHPGSGRVLEVLTTEPGVQFYSGNQLTGSLVGPSSHTYRQGDGFCLETQHFPDSPNQPSFPNVVLQPNERFASTTVFRFGVD